jgi:hypothetical protein
VGIGYLIRIGNDAGAVELGEFLEGLDLEGFGDVLARLYADDFPGLLDVLEVVLEVLRVVFSEEVAKVGVERLGFLGDGVEELAILETFVADELELLLE